jgi:hypothetical protein
MDPDRSSTLITTPTNPRSGRGRGRADLQDQLVGIAQIDPLGQRALAQGPEVAVMAEAAPQQVLGSRPCSTIEGGPFGGDDVSWSRCHQPS